MYNRSIGDHLLHSALTKFDSKQALQAVVEYIHDRRKTINVETSITSLSSLKQWHLDQKSGHIMHTTGRFFAIRGISVETNTGLYKNWDQPIIHQPEIGFLGFLSQERSGVLHLLCQLKIEPGNINYIQISPTLQATRSNFTRLHTGSTPKHLKYFLEDSRPCLFDLLQSEQGARFLKKRNRNIIKYLAQHESLEPHPDYLWLTIGQIKELTTIPNLVNMDTRTVLSCLTFPSNKTNSLDSSPSPNLSNITSHLLLSAVTKRSLHTTAEVLSWITSHKFSTELDISFKSLHHLKNWIYDYDQIYRPDHKYFSVKGISVYIENREASTWDQPIIQPSHPGIIGYLAKSIDGVLHLLVQLKLEAGNLDLLEIAPTVQCITGPYHPKQAEYDVPYLTYFLNAPPTQIIFDSMQSEEGGRFYQEQNRNLLVLLDPSDDIPSNPRYKWLTLRQISMLIQASNVVNISARSILSLIQFI